MEELFSRPIGLFDSGMGGLTVAHAVKQLLPNEHLIYFADTAHLPWGDKSTAAIQAYSVKICDVLLEHGCKVILIACNTASSAAYELVKEYVGSKARVLNVIDPVVHYLQKKSAANVGLIGTRQTVNSNVYKKKIDDLQLGIALSALATPLLVPIIEEGFANSKIAEEAINIYLSDPLLQNIQALILGCTHYPLIKQHINHYYQNNVDILDSADLAAQALKTFLEKNNLLNTTKQPEHSFYVSDYTDTFVAAAKLFFQEDTPLQRYPLWE
jgi:glutamate racemase